MRCYNCNKNFDYEKYYGICPKCGCYNKKETQEEQHQQYHDVYDGGYQHREETHTTYRETGSGVHTYQTPPAAKHTPYVQVQERKPKKGGTVFLLISLVVFLVIVVAGTFLGMWYESSQEKKLQKELIEREVSEVSHAMGESFRLQGMTLEVTEAKTLATEEDLDLPEGKKLVAVKLKGSSDGEWADKNELSDLYIRCDDTCYWQIDSYAYSSYGAVYRMPAFGRYDLSGRESAEGWVAFLVDAEVQEFTLCLEERADENLVYLDAIHSVQIQLEEEEADENN